MPITIKETGIEKSQSYIDTSIKLYFSRIGNKPPLLMEMQQAIQLIASPEGGSFTDTHGIVYKDKEAAKNFLIRCVPQLELLIYQLYQQETVSTLNKKFSDIAQYLNRVLIPSLYEGYQYEQTRIEKSIQLYIAQNGEFTLKLTQDDKATLDSFKAYLGETTVPAVHKSENEKQISENFAIQGLRTLEGDPPLQTPVADTRQGCLYFHCREEKGEEKETESAKEQKLGFADREVAFRLIYLLGLKKGENIYEDASGKEVDSNPNENTPKKKIGESYEDDVLKLQIYFDPDENNREAVIVIAPEIAAMLTKLNHIPINRANRLKNKIPAATQEEVEAEKEWEVVSTPNSTPSTPLSSSNSSTSSISSHSSPPSSTFSFPLLRSLFFPPKPTPTKESKKTNEQEMVSTTSTKPFDEKQQSEDALEFTKDWDFSGCGEDTARLVLTFSSEEAAKKVQARLVAYYEKLYGETEAAVFARLIPNDDKKITFYAKLSGDNAGKMELLDAYLSLFDCPNESKNAQLYLRTRASKADGWKHSGVVAAALQDSPIVRAQKALDRMGKYPPQYSPAKKPQLLAEKDHVNSSTITKTFTGTK